MKIGSVELKTLHPQYGEKSGCLTAAIFNNQVRATEGAELLKLQCWCPFFVRLLWRRKDDEFKVFS